MQALHLAFVSLPLFLYYLPDLLIPSQTKAEGEEMNYIQTFCGAWMGLVCFPVNELHYCKYETPPVSVLFCHSCVVTVFRDQSPPKKTRLSTATAPQRNFQLLLVDVASWYFIWTELKDLRNHISIGKNFYSIPGKLTTQKWHVTLLCMWDKGDGPLTHVALGIMNPFTSPPFV